MWKNSLSFQKWMDSDWQYRQNTYYLFLRCKCVHLKLCQPVPNCFVKVEWIKAKTNRWYIGCFLGSLNGFGHFKSLGWHSPELILSACWVRRRKDSRIFRVGGIRCQIEFAKPVSVKWGQLEVKGGAFGPRLPCQAYPPKTGGNK